ncbi:U-box domain-containing protein 33 isoform X2 [Beta vulgaris subsp. vulgaris]|uniref:U-box domain-containing protein 33 isoform X2 n=1 Tax=Beta vulgaris subsp. vulgaris TaxID=3555 RepID=UPI0020367A5B|nr:U-box domain-containing protein 33 isoform X2 [Beta vulgaris subsp. vulgaris]
MEENKIFVAVGKEIEERKSTLKWALKKSKGETVCVIYVHVPAQIIHLPNGFKAPISSVHEVEVKAFQEWERKEVYKILDDCLQMCAKYQVRADKIYVERESITDGILEVISQLGIQKLVMGGAANNKYSRRMTKPTSKKANYVLKCAPDFCHISFICKNQLICMREGMKQLNQHIEENQLNRLSYSESSVYSESAEPSGSSSPMTESICLELSPASTQQNQDLYEQLQQALQEAEISKREALAELERRQKAELKAAEEELAQVTKELKGTTFELHELSQTIWKAADNISSCRNIEESILKKGPEAEMVFMEKLPKHQMESYELQMECDNVVELTRELRKQIAQESSSSHVPDFFCEFTLLDLKKATKCFDPSLRIGNGDYGSVYKGFLYNTEVAIKRCNPNSLQGVVEFKQEVDVLSKLRHPNLVNLIGACTDSFGLIYEYLPNGNLEDRLSCKDNSPPIPWQTRIRIVTELCSVLNFLHSIQPYSIIHGDLRPKNVLLDANISCKLSGFGLCHIISNNRQTVIIEPKCSSSYMDPEFLSTKHLSHKSDVYSYGIILLRLLTGKPPMKIVEEVQHALENDHLHSILDPSAGDWPVVRAKQLAYMALKCCDVEGRNRPDLGSEVWSVLKPVMNPSVRSSSPLQLISEDQVPSYFICPIFQEIMSDPHFAADGFTYEADALRGWFEGGHDTSPMTNLKIDNHILTPNRALRSAIKEWLEQQQHL